MQHFHMHELIDAQHWPVLLHDSEKRVSQWSTGQFCSLKLPATGGYGITWILIHDRHLRAQFRIPIYSQSCFMIVV